MSDTTEIAAQTESARSLVEDAHRLIAQLLGFGAPNAAIAAFQTVVRNTDPQDFTEDDFEAVDEALVAVRTAMHDAKIDLVVVQRLEDSRISLYSGYCPATEPSEDDKIRQMEARFHQMTRPTTEQRLRRGLRALTNAWTAEATRLGEGAIAHQLAACARAVDALLLKTRPTSKENATDGGIVEPDRR